MSDLFCAATLVVVAPAETDAAGLTDAGQDRIATLARDLGTRNVALVHTSPTPAARPTADALAGALGCAVRVDPELDSGAGTGLDDVADLHRGETVVVVVELAAMRAELPGRVPGLRADDLGLADAAVEVLVDADGWQRAPRSGAVGE